MVADAAAEAARARRRLTPSRSGFSRCRRPQAAGRCRDDGGYSIVEAVITLPVMIVLTMFVVQYALLWHGRNVAEAAAQDGLRTARSYQGTAAMGQQAALDYLSQVAPKLLTSPQVQVDRTPTTVTVHVRAHVLSILGFADVDITEAAAGPVERFVAGSG